MMLCINISDWNWTAINALAFIFMTGAIIYSTIRQNKRQNSILMHERAFELYEYVNALEYYLDNYWNSLYGYLSDRNNDKVVQELKFLLNKKNRINLLAKVLLSAKSEADLFSATQILLECKGCIKKTEGINLVPKTKLEDYALFGFSDDYGKLSIIEKEADTNLIFGKLIIQRTNDFKESEVVTSCKKLCDIRKIK